jgi:hypothetical protein
MEVLDFELVEDMSGLMMEETIEDVDIVESMEGFGMSDKKIPKYDVCTPEFSKRVIEMLKNELSGSRKYNKYVERYLNEYYEESLYYAFMKNKYVEENKKNMRNIWKYEFIKIIDEITLVFFLNEFSEKEKDRIKEKLLKMF